MKYSPRQLLDCIYCKHEEYRKSIIDEAKKLPLTAVISEIEQDEERIRMFVSNAKTIIENGQAIKFESRFTYNITPESLQVSYGSIILKEFKNVSVKRFYNKFSKMLDEKIIEYANSLPF